MKTETENNEKPIADYEPCGDCGFDHSYEQAEAVAWHREHSDLGEFEDETTDNCDICGAETHGHGVSSILFGPNNNLCQACHAREVAKHEDQLAATQAESTSFDKFMDRIVMVESRRRTIDEKIDHPQRIRQMRRQERPLGRIVVNGGKR